MHDQNLRTRQPTCVLPEPPRATPPRSSDDKAATRERQLSIVIPTLNEQGTLVETLERVTGRSVCEVIVVDGGSHDRTLEIASDHHATVLSSAPGRARQLSLGASAATGDTLLFLHADTVLPIDFAEHVSDVLDRPGVAAGAFQLRIDGAGRSFRLVEKVANFRSRVRQMPYGDQAIFVSADVFHAVGGFPDLPIMEDYVLIKRLQRVGRIEIAPDSVVTSARRWIDNGVWRTTLHNQLCLVAYRLGVAPTRIARWRKRPIHPGDAV